jgi:hypothetical protein
MVASNFIHDNVRMEVPPPYFLQRLYDFDNMLVLIPSRHIPFAYVLARRKQFSKGLTDKAIQQGIVQPDTLMCLGYGVVPVCIVYKNGPSWDIDSLLRTLAARDMWTHGGPDRVADMLEAQEAAEKKAIQKATRDDIWNRSGAAWASYKARTGANNTSRYGGTLKSRQERRTNQTAPSSSTVESGLVTLT